MQGKKPFQDKRLASFRLSERVPRDNFYRRLKAIMDVEWLYEATQKYYGREGHKSLDPVVFFKLILIGYLENLLSDRRIIQTVSLRLDLLYFIGYSLDEPLPWHSTISRTRQLLGEEVFKELFKRVLRQCVQQGMVKGKRQALDSVHVKANASMDSLKEKEIVQDGEAYAGELGEDAEDEEQTEKQTVSVFKHQQVQWHHGWKRKAYQGRPSGGWRAKFVSNHTHYSLTDPDARVAVKPGKPRQLNYLGQLSVDTAHHVITCIQADYASKKDSQCLPSLLRHTIDNVKAVGLKVKEVLCDAGYSSSEALKALKQYRVTGYIPNFGQYKPTREGFRYFAGGDYYQCSRGVRLPFKRIKDSHDGTYQMRVYRSSSLDCRNCPLRKTCIGKSDFKKIEDTVDKPLYDEMHLRLQTRKAKRMKRLRQATVEPVIGTLVNFLGMRRVNTRGIQLANKCLLMAAVCYNLKRLLKWMGEAEGKGEKTLGQLLVMLYWLPVLYSRRGEQIQTSLSYAC
ncbi:IS1182 family transposase [Flavisolibacter tropicus]|uniref:Transposase n=1 Tax=Flavisolibacter tropicus TaxID=1492898 RepID=A0A172TXX8_9BACT|nr:IS1182 family transposase [Flavisolibacter tropicus]ANE51949.1 transposase [Flavisolibacter tropicus]